MYATRLGTGSAVEPGEDRPGPARRRVDYSVVRAPRSPDGAAEAARDAARARYVPAPARARNGAARDSGGRPRRARRWRRIVRNAVLAGLVLVAVGLAASRSVEGSAPAAPQTVVVQRGDTIWSLASRHYPDSDPRSRVDQIERLNHLDGPDVRPGERIQLPAD